MLREPRGTGTLYSVCAQSGPDAWDYLHDATPPQSAEVTGALLLCPDHPDRKAVSRLLADSAKTEKLRHDGRVFGPGVYRVGKQIKPGTYVAGNGEGCYWERQNSRGDLIANGFHLNAARVVVTIRSTDYAFNSESCGEWKPAR